MREVEHFWIPMPDGVRLSARAWIPDGGPHPAILEYIPYRKRDLVRPRDERNHPYFAERGYACLRVDMRGSGDSEGSMPDMYGEAELADARDAIEWIASRPWCSGRVGMFGTSWGGTASLQAAAEAPKALRAVIANCATIDRFEDDIHWMGGCLLTDTFEWGATLPAIIAAPPDSATVGAGWRELWNERLESLSCPLENWMRHSERGGYWRNGSVRFDADRLSCPILAVGGWSDRYSNSVMALAAARPDLVWGVVGPWGHHYPDQGAPGPAMGFQDLALAWWDSWLKGDAPAGPGWPRLRLWRREFDPPQDRLDARSGGWIEIARPESPRLLRSHPCVESLAERPSPRQERRSVPFDLSHGACAGDTGYFGRPGGLPLDQAAEDARSLAFDSAPLQEPLDIVGAPVFAADIVRDLSDAQIICRLCDVAPDGRSNLVTRAVLNLALDEALDGLAPFRPGAPRRISIAMPAAAYRFARGHRVRLAIGASYWPLVWPVRADPRLQLLTGEASLDLPMPPTSAVAISDPFPEPKALPARPRWRTAAGGPPERLAMRESDGLLVSSWRQPRASVQLRDIGVGVATGTRAAFSVPVGDPAGALCRMEHDLDIERPDGRVEIRSGATAHGTGEGIGVEVEIAISWNGEQIRRRCWRFKT